MLNIEKYIKTPNVKALLNKASMVNAVICNLYILPLLFRQFYKTGECVIINRSFEDWEPGRTISCNNGSCNKVQHLILTVYIIYPLTYPVLRF